jgi:hypothetical protein
MIEAGGNRKYTLATAIGDRVGGKASEEIIRCGAYFTGYKRGLAPDLELPDSVSAEWAWFIASQGLQPRCGIRPRSKKAASDPNARGQCAQAP